MKTATSLVLLSLVAGDAFAEGTSLRFGINAAAQIPAAELAELGIGRVRFENLKWPMVSAGVGKFAYDGSVAPWHVNVDKILADYTKAGLDVLPFLFQTAAHASTAPEGTKLARTYAYPPKDDAGYAKFVHQTLTRYGSSGRQQLKTVELWNEPNLNAPAWAPWVADMPRYFELFRAGSEAAKKADPKVRVSHAGFAGIDIDTVDQLASYRYADGKTPLDFTDLINVHYYSGRTRPERATSDPNADRSGTVAGGSRTFEDDLRRLRDWRDQFAPGKPIWMTETGYDSAGPHGITEDEQAARLPRCVMLALAGGCESVFVYREKGSTPGQHAASGLLRNDGTKKPAWQTYKTLIHMLGNSAKATVLETGPVRVICWHGEDLAAPVIAAWAVEGTNAFPFDVGACKATDAFGKSTSLKATRDLELTEFPIYLSDFKNTTPIKALAIIAKVDDLENRKASEADTKRRTYLFDFGGDAKVKTFKLGSSRRFAPVTKTQTYSRERGYGFVPREAMQDGYRRWIPDFAECDDCRISKEIAFRFQIEPGRYHIAAGGSPLSKQAVTAQLLDGDKPISNLTFSPEDHHASAEIEVREGDILFKPDAYLDLRWLRIVEAAGD